MQQEESKQQGKQAKKVTNTEEKGKSTARRDQLQEIEKNVQAIWEAEKTYESDPQPGKKKFFLTFPYPYANGRLHLGHGYSYTKCDFTARFKRLMGYNVLMPFGFHVTGMPISAAAQKIQRELAQMQATGSTEYVGQCKSMLQMNIAPEELTKFQDPYYWVHFFPPLGREDLKRFGASIDWRRTFITTDANPYYNSFIEWQFTKLRERGAIKFGKRPSIYSVLDKQMCADHDRREGEGVGPQEYTLIKIAVLKPELISPTLAGKKVYLPAATLRPETMYGQTNCFIKPSGDYGVYEMKNEELFICSDRSALNMSYQDLTKREFQTDLVMRVQGEQLLGLELKAPLSKYEKVYALPMEQIKMDKGTGVVTSVPSDSPDDWATLRDLQKKPEFYKVQKEWTDFTPVPIIETPSYGNLSALAACDEFKVVSQKDAEKLRQAKEKVYLLGFYEGKLLVGEYAGMKVQDAKPHVKNLMISKNEAATYYEPENQVISRSGDECIVALCDQWYLAYNDPAWKDKVRNHLKTQFTVYTNESHKALLETVDWLREWGCSRSFGLGTRLPWDKQYLIESLSDSTLYFAYYTVVQFLQSNFDGSERGSMNIEPTDVNNDVWEYIFLGGPYTENIKISKEKLDAMRSEFLYWYPMDLRCSGKDLIKNHLTMALFNHAAVFSDHPELWPRSYFTNGYILVDGDKMSKQKGNFFTINDLITNVGADATRFGCAQAGDTLDDANFEISLCDGNILKISTLLMYIEKASQSFSTYRTEAKDKHVAFFDEVFSNQIKETQLETIKAFNEMRFRDVMKYGFFNLQSAKDEYLLLTASEGPRKDLIAKFIEVQITLMHPIIPHMTEHAYKVHLLSIVPNKEAYPTTLSKYLLPEVNAKDIDYGILREFKYFTDLTRSIRVAYDKFRTPKKGKTVEEAPQVKKIVLVVAKEWAEWQKQVLTILNSGEYDEKGNPKFDVKALIKANPNGHNDQMIQKQLQFSNFVLADFRVRGREAINPNIAVNEFELVERFRENLLKEFKVQTLEVVDQETAAKSDVKSLQSIAQSCQPLKPTQMFE